MNNVSAPTLSKEPPLYKQAMVGLLVGCTLGPLVGWLMGTFATFVVFMFSDSLGDGPPVTKGMRSTAFAGGLIGIVLGLFTGPLVGLPVRMLSSTVLRNLSNAGLGAILGAVFGLGIGILIHLYWDSTPAELLYLMIHSGVVGGCVGSLAVIAKPKWL